MNSTLPASLYIYVYVHHTSYCIFLFADTKWLPFASFWIFFAETFKWPVNRTKRRHQNKLAYCQCYVPRNTIEGSPRNALHSSSRRQKCSLTVLQWGWKVCTTYWWQRLLKHGHASLTVAVPSSKSCRMPFMAHSLNDCRAKQLLQVPKACHVVPKGLKQHCAIGNATQCDVHYSASEGSLWPRFIIITRRDHSLIQTAVTELPWLLECSIQCHWTPEWLSCLRSGTTWQPSLLRWHLEVEVWIPRFIDNYIIAMVEVSINSWIPPNDEKFSWQSYVSITEKVDCIVF